MSGRRNTLFIIIDQLRADCLFGEMANHVDLPNLRALMGEAVTFRNHWSVCNPCGPSRASILTGQYAMNHRAVRNGTPLPSDRPNLATEVRKGGYRPLLFGYTDIAQDPRNRHPNDPALHTYEEVLPGFQEVVEMRLEESWPWRAHLKSKGYDTPPYPDIFRPDGDQIDDPALYAAEDSDTAFLTDATIKDLRARPPGWFAHLTYIRPHPPFVAPAPYNRMYDYRKLPATARASDIRHPFSVVKTEHELLQDGMEDLPGLEVTDETIARLRAVYLGLATEVDHHIGRVVTFLKEEGIFDDTLIVVTADHGEMLGDHREWGKKTFFDAAYATPLIIRDPEEPEGFGTIVDEITESVDVTPTILSRLGIPVPHSMDGRPLDAFLEGRTPASWRSHSFSELDFGDPISPTKWQRDLRLTCDEANLAILRTKDHTLVQFAGNLPQVLFDRNGANEDCDISGNPNSVPILLDLSRRMLCHRMENPEGTFARTMVTERGVLTGDGD